MRKKIKLALDISPVLQGQISNNNRTGIYQVNKNVLIQLENHKNVDVYIYCKPQLFSILKESKFSHYIRENKVINWREWQFRVSKSRNFLYNRKQLFRDKKNKLFWLLYAVLVELADKFILSTKQRIDGLNSIDGFFSVYEQLPNSVLECNTIVRALYIHDVTMLLFPGLYQKVKSNPVTRIVRTMNNEELFFANSYNTKNDFLKVRPDIKSDRIMVAYPGCSLDFERSKGKNADDIARQYQIKKNRYAFALCSIAPNKNILRIVSSFLEFVKRYSLSDICLVLGGALDGEYGVNLLKKMESIDGFNQYVNYIGYVSDEALPSLYKNAEWFVYTSQYEGFGIPPLEAMMCGCPVIVSDNSSLPEVVGKSGLLIPWDNDEAHIEAYHKYYFDEKLRKQCGIWGKERASTITWQNSVDFIVSTIEKEITA